jgi:transcriptional regulator with GAF, ATPase, and Fis domain
MTTRDINDRVERDFDTKLDKLRSTLHTLLHEVTRIAQPVPIDPVNGIDFYKNVELFEIRLIESALEAAGGKQSRAARLLHLPTSTLCSKIKQFKIRRVGGYPQNELSS